MAAAALFVVTSSAAQSATPMAFADLRRAELSVDASIALLPSDDLRASFNKLSTLLHRAGMEDLEAGAYTDGLLGESFDRAMAAAIEDLDAELSGDFWSLPVEAKHVIVQLVAGYAFERQLELMAGTILFECEPPASRRDAEPCPSPDTLRAMDDLAVHLGPALDEIAAWYESRRGAGPPFPGPPGAGIGYDNFPGRVRDLSEHLSVTGIPSIDDK
jgi:hypothetical protein